MTDHASSSDSQPTSRSRSHFVVVGLTAFAAIFLAAWAMWPRAPSSPTTPSPIPVSTALAISGDFPIVLQSLGAVMALQTVLVRTRVDGEIRDIHFTEGQLVSAGDPLVELDNRPFIAALEQARAKEAQDRATLAGATIDLARYQSLVPLKSIALQTVDQQRSTVNQLEALVKADVALIEAAATQLAYTRITAPISGRLGFRQVDKGNIVSASATTGIVSIAQVSPIAAVFPVPGADFARVRHALEAGEGDVVAYSTNGNRELARGKLSVMDNQLDTISGSIRLKAFFDNTDAALWPGLPVDVRLTVETRRNVVIVPDAAVQRGASGLFVFVVDQGKAKRREVKVDVIADGKALVASGVAAGETVVQSGQYRLADGAAVTVANAAPAPAASAQP